MQAKNNLRKFPEPEVNIKPEVNVNFKAGKIIIPGKLEDKLNAVLHYGLVEELVYAVHLKDLKKILLYEKKNEYDKFEDMDEYTQAALTESKTLILRRKCSETEISTFNPVEYKIIKKILKTYL